MSVINPKFGEKTRALEVVEGLDLTGKEAIVTGASSGIGVETVRALAKAGARVVIATRDLPKAQAVAQQLSKETGSNKIEAEKLDLTSLKSIREFSKNFLAKNRPLHYLINNAGVMGCPLTYTEDGFEMQIGTNHFGHFALTMDLIPALKEGAKQSGKNARVVNVSSIAHGMSPVHFDDIHFKSREYTVSTSRLAIFIYMVRFKILISFDPPILALPRVWSIKDSECVVFGWIDQKIRQRRNLFQFPHARRYSHRATTINVT